MRHFLYLILLTLWMNISYAQSDTVATPCTIKGVIYDQQGTPLPGVTVMERNHRDSTTTDAQEIRLHKDGA